MRRRVPVLATWAFAGTRNGIHSVCGDMGAIVRATPRVPSMLRPFRAAFSTAITRHDGRGMGWPDAPSDHTVHKLALPSGGTLAYCDSGEPGHPNAPLVVCLHGAPGSQRDWRYLAAELENASGAFPCRVVRVDMPGFGVSDMSAAHARVGSTTKPAGDYFRAPTLAAVLHEFMDTWKAQVDSKAADPQASGKRPVFLVAHSIGSTVALELSSTPALAEGLSGLALLAPVCLRPHRAIRPYGVVSLGSWLLDSPFAWVAKALLHLIYVRVLGFPRSTPVRGMRCG